MYSLAGKCPLLSPKGHHHERSINIFGDFNTFLRHAIPTCWVSKHNRARICRSFKETRYRFSARRAGTKPYLSYWPARLHRLANSIPRNRFLGSINVYKYGLRVRLILLQRRSSDAVAAQRWCIPKCPFFLPRGEKLVWRIFFVHFITHIFYSQSFAPFSLQKQTLPLVGWSKK